jgi:hypothetical protein
MENETTAATVIEGDTEIPWVVPLIIGIAILGLCALLLILGLSQRERYVYVIYNDKRERFVYRSNKTVKALSQEASERFGVQGEGLVNIETNTRYIQMGTLASQGINEGDTVGLIVSATRAAGGFRRRFV